MRTRGRVRPLVAVALLLAAPAQAQTAFTVRGFADIGSISFAADRSFKAVLGDSRGAIVGGGVEALMARRIFVSLRASRFRATGERVFLFNDQQFNLGIPVTVTITPLELTGGYRFAARARVIPYAGAGIGWHGYEETSTFAAPDENIRHQSTGFHMLGGAELRLTRWVGAAFDAEWATVPNALGENPASVSREFRESNLGGFTYRLKIVVGQ